MRLVTLFLSGLPAIVAFDPQQPAGGSDVLVLKDGRIFTGLKLSRTADAITAIFANGEITIPKELVQETVITGEPLPEAKTPEEQKALEKGMVRFEGKWVSLKERSVLIEKRIAEKKKAIDDLRAHQLWRNRYKGTSAHFDYEYTLPNHVFTRYRDLLEAYFVDFAKQWKISIPKEKLKVCFYHDEPTYYQTSGAPRGAVAYFKFVKPIELNVYYDRLDARMTETTMFHEANHYLQSLINPGFQYPHFPGESLAEYYGESVWDSATKRFETGLPQEGRLAEIQNDIASGRLAEGDDGPKTGGSTAKAGEMMDLERLLTGGQMYEHYTWGWSLCRFLMDDKRYRAKFQAFILALAYDKDVRRESMGVNSLVTVAPEEVFRQFMKHLGLKDKAALKALEKEWHAYVVARLTTATPRGLQQAAEAAERTGRTIRAKRLYKESIAAGSKDANAYHAYAHLLYLDDKTAEAAELWRRAIELDPMQARLYWYRGKALVKQGNEAEGNRWKALAREIDPEDADVSREVDFGELLKSKEDGGSGSRPGNK